MTEIVIDKEKCTKCGLCASDCITYSIDLVDNGYPKTVGSHCINCQHCLSICPTGALSFGDKKPENSSLVAYDNILDLIKSRRSVRQYKEEEINEEQLTKLKDMFPYIPTGCNSHALHFSIVESRSVMDDLRQRVNSLLIKAISNKYISPIAKKFDKYKDVLLKGEDIIFRNAPHMIVVSSPLTAPCANIDPIIALSYIELYAQTMGLGTCWCGFAEICIKMFPEISEILDIPNGYKPVYAMLLGYPKVKYIRTPQPELYKISEIKEVKTKNSCFFCKAKRVITNFLR